MLKGSNQSVSSLGGTDRFPPVPTNCFELDESWKLATIWKTSFKYDRKEAVFSNTHGGVEVKSKCFKFTLQGSIPTCANDLFWASWGLKVGYNVENEY